MLHYWHTFLDLGFTHTPPHHDVQQPCSRGQSTAAPIARRARSQTAGKLRFKRRIARAAAPTRPKPAHRVNHPPTLPRVDRESNSRGSPPPHQSPNDSAEIEFQPGPARGEGRNYAHKDSSRGGVVRGDHDKLKSRRTWHSLRERERVKGLRTRNVSTTSHLNRWSTRDRHATTHRTLSTSTARAPYRNGSFEVAGGWSCEH